MRNIDSITLECNESEKNGFDEFQATEHLSDKEFLTWYINDNKIWWDKYRIYHRSLLCQKCRIEIKSPEELGSWRGVNYHILCMIEELSTKDIRGNYKKLYERIKKVFNLIL